MKIENKILKKFVSQVGMNGMLKECVFNFEKEGLSVISMSEDSVSFVSNKLSNSNFIEYENFGKIALDNLSLFLKFLGRFKDSSITIKKEENLLKFDSDSINGEYVLASSEYLKEQTKIPLIKYKNSFKLNISVLKEAYISAEVLDNVFQTLIFEIKNQTLLLKTGETNKLNYPIKIEEKVINCRVKFGEPLGKVVNLMEDEVIIKLGKDLPITLEQKTENSKLLYIVAQRQVDEEENDKENINKEGNNEDINEEGNNEG